MQINLRKKIRVAEVIIRVWIAQNRKSVGSPKELGPSPE
jgi:hypothetical protein